MQHIKVVNNNYKNTQFDQIFMHGRHYKIIPLISPYQKMIFLPNNASIEEQKITNYNNLISLYNNFVDECNNLSMVNWTK